MTWVTGKAVMIARMAGRRPITETLISTEEPRRVTAHVSATANSTADIFAKHSTTDTTLTPIIKTMPDKTIAINTRTVITTAIGRDADATGMVTATLVALLNFVRPL